MGCYGIGITRTVAAAIEQNHDDDGIIWPLSLAPFEALVVPVNCDGRRELRDAPSVSTMSSGSPASTCSSTTATSAPGVKFKDADLIGIPVRIAIGEKGLAEGKIEVRSRRTAETIAVPIADATSAVISLLEKA